MSNQPNVYQAPPTYQQLPKAPGLTPRQRTGALIAGAVSFALVSLGFTVFVALGAVLLIGLIAAFIVNLAVSASDLTSRTGAVSRFVDQLDPTLVILVVIAAVVLGLVLLLFGFLSSKWILSAYEVHRPIAVTWSGLGVAVVANWVASGIITTFSALAQRFSDTGVFAWFIGGFGVLVVIAVGAFSWWWVAHLFRARPAIVQTAC